ncbi:MAG: hypothetical protein M3P11_11945 [Actinomycetota bacterium]|nr:hypothetical protein [Actinomycetota bacterium]
MDDEIRTAARPKRSRRELLAGAAGAAGVIAAQAVVGAKPAYATDPNDVVLGADNQLTAGTTGVQSSAVTALHGRSTNAGGTGVFGEDLHIAGIGVHGTGGTGVQGDGTVGVLGQSTEGYGVYGQTNATGFPGIFGASGQADGVWGQGQTAGVHGSNTGAGPGLLGGDSQSTDGDGVEGQTQNAFSSGIYGHNDSNSGGGKGVFGASPNGIAVEGLGGQVGVHGISPGDIGVKGEGVGTGVQAVSTLANHAGVGLRVDGRSVFRTAGVATVASGTNTVSVSLAGVTATDMVLATVQQGGVFFVKNAVAGSGKFTIHLNKAPVSPATVKVAWFVISAA